MEGTEWLEVASRVRGVLDKCQSGTVGHPRRCLASANYYITHKESSQHAGQGHQPRAKSCLKVVALGPQ